MTAFNAMIVDGSFAAFCLALVPPERVAAEATVRVEDQLAFRRLQERMEEGTSAARASAAPMGAGLLRGPYDASARRPPEGYRQWRAGRSRTNVTAAQPTGPDQRPRWLPRRVPYAINLLGEAAYAYEHAATSGMGEPPIVGFSERDEADPADLSGEGAMANRILERPHQFLRRKDVGSDGSPRGILCGRFLPWRSLPIAGNAGVRFGCDHRELTHRHLSRPAESRHY